MDRTKRIFGTCARGLGDGDNIALLPSTLATNLLLFEKYVMLSCRLLEIPQIVAKFGYSQTLELLKSNALEINCDPSQVVIMGDTNELVNSGRALHYDIAIIRSEDHEDYLSSCFQHLHEQIPESEKNIRKLKDAIFPLLDLSVRSLEPSKSAESKAARAVIADLKENLPTLKRAVVLELKEKYDKNILVNDFKLNFHHVNDDVFKAETNLQKKLKFNESKTHELIQNAIFRLVDINQGIAYMDKYNALNSMNDTNLSILEDKLQFFARELRSEKYTEQFERVMEIKGFPDLELLSQMDSLKLDKILELRECKEIKQFRAWLPEITSKSDEEIREQIESLKLTIGNFLPTTKGKTVRFLVSQAIGLFSGIPFAGIPISLVNTFLLEKIFPTSGPISFINNKLPTMFEFNKGKQNDIISIFNR